MLKPTAYWGGLIQVVFTNILMLYYWLLVITLTILSTRGCVTEARTRDVYFMSATQRFVTQTKACGSKTQVAWMSENRGGQLSQNIVFDNTPKRPHAVSPSDFLALGVSAAGV